MKKLVLIFVAAFTFSTFFTSCREVNEDRTRVEAHDDVDAVDDLGNDIERAADDVGNSVERAADDVGNSVERAAQDVEDEIQGNDDLQ